MALIGEQNQSACTTMPFDRRKEALTLDGEGSCVVVGITMDQQQGSAQFVGIHKRRHRIIDLRDLPVGTGLRLETEGGQGAVVGTTTSDTGFKQVGMRQQIGCHETAIRVSTYCQTSGVTHAQVIDSLSRCLGIHRQLMDEVIVRLRTIHTDNRHLHVLHDREATGHPEDRRTIVDDGKEVFRASHLGGIIGVTVFTGIGPHQYG